MTIDSPKDDKEGIPLTVELNANHSANVENIRNGDIVEDTTDPQTPLFNVEKNSDV